MVNVSSAYNLAIIVCAVMFIISAVVANLISFKPDMSDVAQRKVWFWVLGVLNVVVGLGLNYGIFFTKIHAHSKQNDFLTAMAIAAAVSFILYVVAGFIAAKISKTGKLSNWF